MIGGLAAGALALLTSPASATFPGQNGRIVFADGGHIATVNPDGSGLTLLTAGAGNSDPSFSASGERIVYSHRVGRHHVIVAMRADGTHKRALTRRHADHSPAFSPSGRRIAFSRRGHSGEDTFFRIWVMRADGTHRRQLTHDKPVFQARHDQPSFSPGGKKILFESVLAEDSGIGLIHADGSATAARFPDGAVEPSFAPGGKRILFTYSFAPTAEIDVIDADGSDPRHITNNADPNAVFAFPSYSPDGTRIVFSSGDSLLGPARGDIYTMNADGTGLTQLTSDGRSLAPDWGPLPVS